MLLLNKVTFWEELDAIVSDSLGLSARQICRIAKISPATRFGLENGSYPRRKTLMKINRVLDSLSR